MLHFRCCLVVGIDGELSGLAVFVSVHTEW